MALRNRGHPLSCSGSETVTLQAPGILVGGFPNVRIGGRTLVMGILNVTPDSFSGDGLLTRRVEEIVARGRRLAADGADVLDVGGESTRPGADAVPADVELDRVLPVIERLASVITIPISIDTRKAAVAEAALRVGASIVNDVSGLRFDPRLVEVAARADAGLIIGHWAERDRDNSDGIMECVTDGLRESVLLASRAGVARARIVIDPGLGFAKPPAWSFEIQREWPRLRALLGLPILIGASRKQHIGRAMGDVPVGDRQAGSLAAAAVAAEKGADMVRVHDVRESVGAVRVGAAIGRGWSDRAMTWKPAYLGIGSNIGDRVGTIAAALTRLSGQPGLRVLRRAALFETAPIGVLDQPAFVNTVVEAETTLSPHQLLAAVKRIEQQLGRESRARWGPREIDIDILLYGAGRVDQPGLTIPHREMWNRLFVLAPLAELQPTLVRDGGSTIVEHLRVLGSSQQVASLGW